MSALRSVHFSITSRTRRSRAGFTLVETLVALTIIMVALTGVFSAVSSSLQGTTVAKNKVTAFYLIQEGFEYVKNERDRAALAGTAAYPAWLGTFQNCIDSRCTVDVFEASGSARTEAAANVCSGNCPLLEQRTQPPVVYGHGLDSARTTTFRRAIEVRRVHDHEVVVTVTVSWQGAGGSPRSIEISETITQWR